MFIFFSKERTSWRLAPYNSGWPHLGTIIDVEKEG